MITALLIATLFLPKSNDATLNTSPLQQSETVYLDNHDGTVEMRIGSAGAMASDVVPRQSIRTYEAEVIDRSKYAYTMSPQLAYVPSGDYWTKAGSQLASNATYTLTFQCASDVRIHSFNYKIQGHGLGMMGGLDGGYEHDYEINNNIVTLRIFARVILDELKVSNPIIKVLKYGNPNVITDFNKQKLCFYDTLNQGADEPFDFADMRSFLLGYYNGNRGADWSDYKAKNLVRMEKHAMSFGTVNSRSNDAFRVSANRVATNAFTISKGTQEAVTVTDLGDAYVESGNENFRVITIAASNRTAWVTLDITGIASFDATKLTGYQLIAEGVGDDVWRQVPLTIVSSANNRVVLTIEGALGGGIYSFSYGAATVLVKVNGVLRVNRLQLMGDDNQLYELHINGGTITASAVN